MPKIVGVLGGGQLGRMLIDAANPLGVRVNVLDVAGSPAKQVSNHDGHIEGSFKDGAAIRKLATRSDVITVEIEHVDTEVLEELEKSGIDVQPRALTIKTIQDKFVQKQFLHEHGVSTAESLALTEPTVSELRRAADALGLPLMLKSRRDAYDGRGNFAVRSEQDFDAALQALSGGGKAGGLYAEKWAPFKMELAVMVVKTATDVLSFATVETVHENSICKLVYAPARNVSTEVNERAQALARKAVAGLWGKGVFGVEMFLLPDDSLLINEMAPRPHNSGHYTINACPVNQFEAHLRAILDLPLHASDLQPSSPSIMLNILGGDTPEHTERLAQAALAQRGTRLYMYGKGAPRKGRKMGHINVVAPTMAEAETLIAPLIAIDRGSTNDNTTLSQTTIPSTPKFDVAVIMGSDSDLPVVQPGLKILQNFSIPHTVRITSAHRTPDWMAEFARNASANGIKVIIAAAGGAAHLPGMAAAHTSLPVIGIPVKPSIGDGTDSLLSICNMPRGVPVATVGVNNSVNAALLAVRILGVGDEMLRARTTETFMRQAELEVREKDRKLLLLGSDEYARTVLGK